MTGQQITATLSGIVGKITAYTWSITPSATVFKTYNENAASNQLVALGSADLTGTDTTGNGISVAPLKFYDRKQENVTVNCAVSFTAPDGTALSATAKSSSISILKPTASWGVDPKTVPVNGAPSNTNAGFHDNSSTLGSYGAVTIWCPITVTVPSPFPPSSGKFCLAQTTTPSSSVTGTPIGNTPSTYYTKIKNMQNMYVLPGTGLDKSFPYPEGYVIDATGNITDTTNSSQFNAGNIGGSGDNPSGGESPPSVDTGGTNWISGTLNDQFTTWLMYQPPGGVWVPLQSATWSVTGNATGGPNNWSATGKYSPASPSDTNVFPQWSTIISGALYEP